MVRKNLRIGIDSRGAKRGADEWQRQTTRVRKDSAKAVGSVRGLRASFSSTGRVGLALRSDLAGIFGGILAVGGARSAIRVIASFEESLVTLQGVTRATAGEFIALEDAARDLGASTRFTATEASEGLLFLGRAGFTALEGLQAIPDVLNLAQVGLIGLGEAADLSSNVLRQFQLDATDIVEVVDALVIVSNRSNTNIQQLGSAFKFAGPIAGALGNTVEETAAALGALGDRGIQASLAGTSLRGSLLNLTQITPKQQQALDKLNLTQQDVDVSTKSLVEVFEAFGKAGLDAATANQLFNKRNAAAALILSQSTDEMKELIAATKEYEGEAKKIADLQAATLIGVFKQFTSSVKEGALQLGDAGLTGAVKELLGILTTAVRQITKTGKEIEGLEKKAKILSVVVGTVLVGAVIKLTAAMVGFSLAVLTNPFTIIATGIAAATAAIIVFRDQIVTIGGRTAAVRDLVVASFVFMKERVELVFRTLLNIFQVPFNGLVEIVKDSFSLVIDFVNSTVGGIFDAFNDLLASRNTGLGDSLKKFANFAIATFVAVGDSIIAIINKLSDAAIAFNAFDPLSPLDSLKEIGRNLGFVGSEIRFEATNAFREAFDTDFVGNITEIVGGAFEQAQNDLKGEGKLLSFDDLLAETERVRTTISVTAIVAAIEAIGTASVEAFTKFKTFGSDAFKTAEQIQAELDLVNEEIVDLSENTKNLADAQALANGTAGALGDTIRDAFDGEGDLLKGFILRLREVGIELLFIKPLLDSLSGNANQGTGAAGFFNSFFGGVPQEATAAKGFAVSSGFVKNFQRGGIDQVLTGPTSFPLADGRVGVAGEAGFEAAFAPLTRDPASGDLAVKAVGGGGPSNVTINVTTPDANSFRRSERQIGGEIKRMLG